MPRVMNGMSYRLENIWLIMVMDCQNVICWRMLGVTWMLENIGGYGNMGQTGAKVFMFFFGLMVARDC